MKGVANLAMEGFLFTCGLVGLGGVAGVHWLVTGHFPEHDFLGYGLLFLIVGIILARTEEYLSAILENMGELKKAVDQLSSKHSVSPADPPKE